MAASSATHHRFSRQGFQRLHPQADSTVHIPMNRVPSPARSYQPASPNNEKQGLHSPAAANGHRRSIKPGMSPQQAGSRAEMHGHDEEDTLTKMGVFYDKFRNFSVVTRYLVYVVPVGAILAVPIIISSLVKKESKIGGVPTKWFFSWLLIAWCSLWISKIVAHFLPFIFQALVGVVSPGVRKYSQAIVRLELYISLVGWALISLATFRPIVSNLKGDPATTPDPHDRGKNLASPHWVNIVSRILAALLISSIILLFEKVLVQLITINYHRKQFNSRIKDSKHDIFLLSLLYDASRAMFPAFCEEFAEEDAIISDSINMTASNKQGKSGMHTPMAIVQQAGRVGGKVAEKATSAFGHVAHEVTGKDTFAPDSAHGVVIQALEKNKSAEALGRRIWLSFVVEGNDALYTEDVVEVLGAGRQPEAEACFGALDRDSNGDVSLDEMILTVTEFGRERHAISNSMQDVDQAIKVLDGLLVVVAFIAAILVLVSFLVTSFYTTLATTGTALLSLSFVFSTTAQELLGSCIFLFTKHPYDIGDRVEILEEQLVVEHISLLFSIFRKVASNQLVQVPHIILNSLWINNISRSKAMREHLNINIDFNTTFEDVQLLRSEMTKFVLDPANSRDFFPDLDIQVLSINDMDKMTLRVDLMHKSNWANEAVRAARRSKFMCALVLALRCIPINPPGGAGAGLGDPANPSYSVAISPSLAERNKADAAAAAEAKRLAPTTKSTLSEKRTTVQSEQQAVNALNERNYATDKSRDHSDDMRDRTKVEAPELEEVRTVLKKESMKGRRKSTNLRRSVALQSSGSTKSNRSYQQRRVEDPVPPTPTVMVEAPRSVSAAESVGLAESNRREYDERSRRDEEDVEALPALPAVEHSPFMPQSPASSTQSPRQGQSSPRTGL